ncbi:MAG: hypothetical protein PVH29_12430 [Candidatus Zixiibacteriota bacterium]|jgi:hypothetical protein
MFTALAVFVALAAAYSGYTIDDAYISLRYARNVAAGAGFVFDEAPAPVEGYTNFLWVTCEAALFAVRLPGDILTWVKVLGVLWGVGALAATYVLGKKVYGARAGALGALFIAALGNFAFWAVGGLETAQYICLLLLALVFSVSAAGNTWAALAAGATWALAAMARPEGVAVGAIVLLYGLVASPSGKPRGRFLLAGAALAVCYGVYFGWRWRYFDTFLPNTYYARAGLSPGTLLSRVRGLWPFLLYAVPPAAFALGWARGAKSRGAGFLWAATAASLVLAFASRREWMPAFRYELPFAAALWILAAGPFAAWARRRPAGVAVICTVLVAAYAFVPAAFLFDEVDYTRGLDRAHVALGKWMAEAAPAGISLAAWDMGALPYFADPVRVYDINPEGLLSRETTRHGYRPDYFINQRPTFFVLYSSSAEEPAAPEGHWSWRYYRSREFGRSYYYLFTFTMRPGYNLRVYALRGTEISVGDITRGEALAGASRNP